MLEKAQERQEHAGEHMGASQQLPLAMPCLGAAEG